MVGDLILVNKFHYGIRLPVINKKIIANHDVQRGDVMVFRYPDEPGAGTTSSAWSASGRRGQLPEPAPVPSTGSWCRSPQGIYDDSGDSPRYSPALEEQLGEASTRSSVYPKRPLFRKGANFPHRSMQHTPRGELQGPGGHFSCDG